MNILIIPNRRSISVYIAIYWYIGMYIPISSVLIIPIFCLTSDWYVPISDRYQYPEFESSLYRYCWGWFKPKRNIGISYICWLQTSVSVYCNSIMSQENIVNVNSISSFVLSNHNILFIPWYSIKLLINQVLIFSLNPSLSRGSS